VFFFSSPSQKAQPAPPQSIQSIVSFLQKSAVPGLVNQPGHSVLAATPDLVAGRERKNAPGDPRNLRAALSRRPELIPAPSVPFPKPEMT
jgi:hypothetical protein